MGESNSTAFVLPAMRSKRFVPRFCAHARFRRTSARRICHCRLLL